MRRTDLGARPGSAWARYLAEYGAFETSARLWAREAYAVALDQIVYGWTDDRGQQRRDATLWSPRHGLRVYTSTAALERDYPDGHC